MRLPSSVSMRIGRGVAVAMVSAVLMTALQPSMILAKQAKPSFTLPKGISAQVLVGKTQGAVPSSYLGIALEMSGLCQFLTTDTLHRVGFEKLFTNIGPVVLKIGGKGADYSTWKPNGKAACSTKGTVVNQAEVTDVAAFASRVNAKIVWGLPLIKFNTKAAATEAKAVAQTLGSHLVGWTPGNEPDLYTGAGMRPKSWKISQFLSQWESERSAVQKVAPTVKFIGPESCCNNTYFEDFAKTAGSQVESLTYHEYAGSKTGETAAFLMAPKTLTNFVTRADYYYKMASKFSKAPLWLSEVNTFPAGGVKGVSNAYVSGLWLADLLFQLERHHVAQVDIQSLAGLDNYDPLSKASEPRPLYSGMIFYHQAVPAGSKMLSAPTTLAKSVNVTSYAVSTPSGGVNLILFNKGKSAATVQFNANKIYSSAADYRMAAPSLTSLTGIKIGGQTIRLDGTVPPPILSPLTLKKTVETRKLPSVSTGTIKLAASTATVISLAP